MQCPVWLRAESDVSISTVTLVCPVPLAENVRSLKRPSPSPASFDERRPAAKGTEASGERRQQLVACF